MLQKLNNLDVANKRVIVRVDLNLPIVHGKIVDLSRIVRIIPTISYLLKNKAKVILISHYGRPEGKFILKMSLAPMVDTLSELFGVNVKFATDLFSSQTRSKIDSLNPGEIILLENLRFYPEEENNDLEFAKKLASFADIYVNEAFACSHRAHASITSLPALLPSYSGMLLQEEIENLEKYFLSPQRKMMSIVGGAKISTKIGLLNALIKKSDYLVIGGAMANTFLRAQGVSIGTSLCDKNYDKFCLELLKSAENSGCEVILPKDIVTAQSFDTDSQCRVCDVDDIPAGEMIFDIGPSSVINIIEKMQNCKTLIWNGPLGAFENTNFSAGTTMVSRAAAKFTAKGDLVSVVGGGDTVAAISEFENQFTYASTGGGAFLEWLEGNSLPGLEVLYRKGVEISK